MYATLTVHALLGVLAFAPPTGPVARTLDVTLEFPGWASPKKGQVVGAALVCPDAKPVPVELVKTKTGSRHARLEGPDGTRCVLEVAVGKQILETAIRFGMHGLEHATLTQRNPVEIKSLPVGSSSSRDFTAVVDMSASSARGISLAGSTSAESQFQAGSLTAAAVDDLAQPNAFSDFAAHSGASPGLDAVGTEWAAVRVVNRQGEPVRGAMVEVGQKSLRTRADGQAVFLGKWDAIANLSQARARVSNGASVPKSVSLRSGHTVVAVVDGPAARNEAVDLLLMVDVTGSMGDELHYLQVELDSIFERLERKHHDLDLRVGLLAYRDQGDEFVVRGIDFTRGFDHFHAALSEQSAGGGGDMPEAVHTAFQAAGEMRWRSPKRAARLVVHLADAPPHEEHTLAALQAVDRLREQGTAVYPVAASGVDSAGEFFMRSAALMTGAQYLFLTDDSGYGSSHREATAACFQVNTLALVLGNILDAEVRGKRPKLPTTGSRQGGSGCSAANATAKRPFTTPTGAADGSRPGIPRKAPASPRSDLSRSLFDDDAAARFRHEPYTRHQLH